MWYWKDDTMEMRRGAVWELEKEAKPSSENTKIFSKYIKLIKCKARWNGIKTSNRFKMVTENRESGKWTWRHYYHIHCNRILYFIFLFLAFDFHNVPWHSEIQSLLYKCKFLSHAFALTKAFFFFSFGKSLNPNWITAFSFYLLIFPVYKRQSVNRLFNVSNGTPFKILSHFVIYMFGYVGWGAHLFLVVFV